MKFLTIMISSFILSTSFADSIYQPDLEKEKIIHIGGPAANYLHQNVPRSAQRAIDCYIVHAQNGFEPRCDLSVTAFSEGLPNLYIEGSSADELFHRGDANKTINCFIPIRVNGDSKVGCELDAEFISY